MSEQAVPPVAATLSLERIGGELAREVKERSGTSPMSCFQCAKCTSGCPVASRADLRPHELVRLVQLDQRRAVLGSRAIWECTSCQTCATRCPQKVDIAAMNDALRAMSLAAGAAAPGTTVPIFDRVFLNTVRERGRVHELWLMAEFKLRALAVPWSTWRAGGPRSWAELLRSGARQILTDGARQLLADADKAPLMIARGKLPLLGARVRGKARRKAMFRRAAGGKS